MTTGFLHQQPAQFANLRATPRPQQVGLKLQPSSERSEPVAKEPRTFRPEAAKR